KDGGFEFELFISNEDQEISEVQTFLEYIETNDVYDEKYLELLDKAEPYMEQKLVVKAKILYSLSKKPWENDDWNKLKVKSFLNEENDGLLLFWNDPDSLIDSTDIEKGKNLVRWHLDYLRDNYEKPPFLDRVVDRTLESKLVRGFR